MKFKTMSDGTLYWMHRVYDGRWHVGAYHPYVADRPERIVDDITVAADALEQCLAEITSAPRRDPDSTGIIQPWFTIDEGIDDQLLPPAHHDVLIARRLKLVRQNLRPIIDVAHINRNGLWVLSDSEDAARPIAWTLLPTMPLDPCKEGECNEA